MLARWTGPTHAHRLIASVSALLVWVIRARIDDPLPAGSPAQQAAATTTARQPAPATPSAAWEGAGASLPSTVTKPSIDTPRASARPPIRRRASAGRSSKPRTGTSTASSPRSRRDGRSAAADAAKATTMTPCPLGNGAWRRSSDLGGHARDETEFLCTVAVIAPARHRAIGALPYAALSMKYFTGRPIASVP